MLRSFAENMGFARALAAAWLCASASCVDPHRQADTTAQPTAETTEIDTKTAPEPEHTRPDAPAITTVAPAYGTTLGLQAVTIRGAGFENASDVLFGETAAVAFKVIDDTRIEATSPPRPPGAVDVIVRVRNLDELGTRVYDDLLYAAGYTFIAPVAVSSVEPASGPRIGGTIVTVTGAGFAADTAFVFGDRLGIDPVVIDDTTATVIAPANVTGHADVYASNGAGSSRLKDGFEYLESPDAPGAPAGETGTPVKLTSSTPYHLSVDGGTAVQISFKPGLTELGAVLSMRIGPLAAASVANGPVSAKGEGVLSAVAPKGSPGPADLVVIFEKATLVAKKAFVFESKKPRISAIIPGRGSQSGGTWVRVIGSGLGKLEGVRFGQNAGTKLQVKDDGLAWIWTPAGKPGPVDAEAWFGPHTSKIGNAFVYFDPAAGNLGTWGDAIEHTVNVTVTQRYVSEGGPVHNAWVIMGSHPDTPNKGLTDVNGQITFSGPDIQGPVSISASKADHTAASVIAFNTENVTLLIRNRHPPSQGSPGPSGPPKQFSPGTIEGHVIGAQKYIQLPMGSCNGKAAVDGHCKPCDSDDMCGAGTTCELLSDPLGSFDLGGSGGGGSGGGGSGGGGSGGGAAVPGEATSTGAPADADQKFCSAACLANTDCPSGFECRAISLLANDQKFRCTPRVGIPQTRCEVSRYSFFSNNDDPGYGWIADSTTGKFSIGSRLGEVAVYCRGGYLRESDGVYVALAMGVKRNIIVESGDLVTGVTVNLNIPLRRRIRARLEDLPVGEDTIGYIRFVDAKLQLGGDGWIPMGLVSTTQRTDTMVLPEQPSTLSGPLKDVHYAFYAGVYNPGTSLEAPSALGWAEQLKPAATDTFVWWPKGAAAPEAKSSFAAPIASIAQAGDLAVAVGDGGSVSVWSGQGWTQQSSPTTVDLRSVWLAKDGTGWAGGDLGTVLRRHPTTGWGKAPSPTIETIVAVAGGPSGVWLLDHDHRFFRRDAGKWHEHAPPITKPVSKPIAPGVTVESARLGSLWQAPDGTLFCGGDSGQWFIGTLTGQTLKWQAMSDQLGHRIRGFTGVSAADVWLFGDRGTLAHFDGTDLKAFDTKTRQPLHAGRLLAGAAHFVGGQGVWLVVENGALQDHSPKLGLDLRGIVATEFGIAAAGHAIVALGPYLEMPYITEPKSGAGISNKIAWKTNGGNTPDLNWVMITGYYPWAEWEILARGDLNEVELPSFSALGAFNPLPPGGLNVHVRRILAPSLTIDRFNYKKLSLYDWTSYAYGHKQAVAGLGQGGSLP